VIDTEIIGGTAIRERELATGDIEYVIVYDSDEEEEGEVRYIPTSSQPMTQNQAKKSEPTSSTTPTSSSPKKTNSTFLISITQA